MISLLTARTLPGLTLALALAGVGLWLIDVLSDRARLRAELVQTQAHLTQAQAALERAADVARIHRAHLSRAATETRRWSDLFTDLQLMEGRNAPLSPLLDTTAERLFGTAR
eukprot:GHVR01146273.1.p1 GENE.GHVR01146273.1~~GHVR01146273.1.p1  ORF type:complete len:112 (-),score=26.93 GHVR01146273.1:411-746(-)